LLSKSIDLDVFVTDVANVIRYEDLNDVVLVGHSFGGNSISGVADIMRDRLRQLIYLDAVILENGQSVFSQLPKDVVEARTRAAQETIRMAMPTTVAGLEASNTPTIRRLTLSRRHQLSPIAPVRGLSHIPTQNPS
jgi:pimeloyl-ACP methyl ester carboxylesterase